MKKTFALILLFACLASASFGAKMLVFKVNAGETRTFEEGIPLVNLGMESCNRLSENEDWLSLSSSPIDVDLTNEVVVYTPLTISVPDSTPTGYYKLIVNMVSCNPQSDGMGVVYSMDKEIHIEVTGDEIVGENNVEKPVEPQVIEVNTIGNSTPEPTIIAAEIVIEEENSLEQNNFNTYLLLSAGIICVIIAGIYLFNERKKLDSRGFENE